MKHSEERGESQRGREDWKGNTEHRDEKKVRRSKSKEEVSQLDLGSSSDIVC